MFVATDADGDVVTLNAAGTVLVNVEDDIPALVVSPNELVSANVDEDELDDGITDDPDGENTIDTITAGDLGGLVNFGADQPGSFSFNAAASGTAVLDETNTAVESNDTAVFYFLDGDTLWGSTDVSNATTAEATAVFKIVDDGVGTFTFTLLDQIDHPGINNTLGGDNEDLGIDLSRSGVFVATDADGDVVMLNAAGTVLVNVEDDVPNAINPDAASSIENDGMGVATEALDFFGNVGADQTGTVYFTGINGGSPESDGAPLLDTSGDPVTSGGFAVTLSGFGTQVLTAEANGNTVFTITLKPDMDTYTIDFDAKLDDGSGIDFTSLAITSPGNPRFALIDGPQNAGGESQDILISATQANGDPETVNVSQGKISVQNNGAGITDGEIIRIDLVKDLSIPGSNFGDQVYNYFEHYTANGFTFTIPEAEDDGLGTNIVFRIYDADSDDPDPPTTPDDHSDALTDSPRNQDTISEILVNGVSLDLTPNVTTMVGGDPYLVTLDGMGDYVVSGFQDDDVVTIRSADGYNQIELENLVDAGGTKDGFNINKFLLEQTNEGGPLNMLFDVAIADADGDTASGEIAVGLVPEGSTPPVILDLDGDGIETTDLSTSTVAFDYDGDGNLEHTAWVGADDGLLAIDLNGDGKVNDGSEIVFSQYADGAETDLEGLAMAFDTNHDGQLTAADEQFDKFGVWQDADSDGVTDEGEFTSLSDLGIESIGLTNDGNQSVSEDGSVTTFGYSEYINADGSTGLVGDVAFANYTQGEIDGAIAGGLDADNSGQEAQTYVIDGAAAAEIIAEFQAGIDEIDLSDILTLASDTDVEAANVVHYNSETGDLSVDAAGNASDGGGAVVANVGTGLGDETIKILFNDGNGSTSDDVV